MLCTVYGQTVCDPFNDDFQLLFARPKAVSGEEMRTVLRGLQGDADCFKFLHEDTGLWVHEGHYGRELGSLEVLVAEICSGLLFLDGASVLSIDDDQIAMRSRLAAVKMGLSNHVNPRKREGILQLAMYESKLAECCGVVTDSSMTIAEISSALMKAKRQGEDNINQRREYLFAKCSSIASSQYD